MMRAILFNQSNHSITMRINQIHSLLVALAFVLLMLQNYSLPFTNDGGQRVEQPLLCVIAFYQAVFAHYVINGDRNYISPIAIQCSEERASNHCDEGARLRSYSDWSKM